MRGRLGGHAPKSEIRSIMVSSMKDNVVGDGEVVDGKHMTSKARDVGDNGRMTCGAKVLGGGVEYSGGMKVSSIEQPVARPPPRSPTQPPPRPRPRISYILTTMDVVRVLMDGPCEANASSSCATMRWSSPIKRETNQQYDECRTTSLRKPYEIY